MVRTAGSGGALAGGGAGAACSWETVEPPTTRKVCEALVWRATVCAAPLLLLPPPPPLLAGGGGMTMGVLTARVWLEMMYWEEGLAEMVWALRMRGGAAAAAALGRAVEGGGGAGLTLGITLPLSDAGGCAAATGDVGGGGAVLTPGITLPLSDAGGFAAATGELAASVGLDACAGIVVGVGAVGEAESGWLAADDGWTDCSGGAVVVAPAVGAPAGAIGAAASVADPPSKEVDVPVMYSAVSLYTAGAAQIPVGLQAHSPRPGNRGWSSFWKSHLPPRSKLAL